MAPGNQPRTGLKSGIYNRFPLIYTRTAVMREFPDEGKVLDLGCGSGGLLRMLKAMKPGLEMYGTDIGRDEDLPDYVSFFPSDLNEGIGWDRDDYFDVVVSTHVIEHLENPDVCVGEIRRVARTGAAIFLEVPSARSLFLPSLSSIEKDNPAPINFYDDPTHLRPYTKKSMYRLVTAAGLQVLKTGHVRHYGGLVASPLLFVYAVAANKRDFLVHSIWNLVGWSCYCTATKPESTRPE